MIKYSDRAIKGLVFLFRPYNDIDIYVEDEACRNLYEALLNRMLEGKARITRIFQLGGRQKVLEACRLDQNDRARRRLYLIDGDFDCIINNRITTGLKYFYQLQVYCSENLLLSETAIREICFESLTDEPHDKVLDSINYSGFKKEILKLIPLLTIYIVVYTLNSGIQTFGYNVTNLINSNPIELSTDKIEARIKNIKKQLSAHYSKIQIDAANITALTYTPNDYYNLVRFISGKSYLIPFLFLYLRKQANLSGNLNQLKVRLAQHCNLDLDKGLLSIIKQTSKGI